MGLIVEGLTIKYPYGAEAVKNLSFSLEKGQKLAVFSPAEGGKTSLLKCLSGIVRPHSGEILFDNKPLDIKKDILTVYQDQGVFSFKSVFKQLEYPLVLRKMDKKQRQELVYSAAAAVQITHLLPTLGRQLDEDDKVKLKIARLLIRKANLVLIDNPFNVLKSQQRLQVFDQLLPIIRQSGAALVFATDSLDEALSVGDNVLVLNYGIPMQMSTPSQLLTNPQCLFVDKLVNPFNRRFCQDNIIISQEYVQSESGQTYKKIDYFYQNNQLFVKLENDIIIKADYLKEEYTVKLINQRRFCQKTETIAE